MLTALKARSVLVCLNVFLPFVFLLFQRSSVRTETMPIETTVCKILENPSRFNNKLVRVRGEVSVSFEYSMLRDPSCSDAIWFALADNLGPPGLVAIVNGGGKPGGHDSKGIAIPPIQVRLVHDSSFEKFEHYMQIKADQRPCLNDLEKPTPPDCGVERVIATFTGRIDGVSKKLHAAHLRRSSNDKADFRGFGHMGMFDVQLVVQRVEDVSAQDSFGREKP